MPFGGLNTPPLSEQTTTEIIGGIVFSALVIGFMVTGAVSLLRSTGNRGFIVIAVVLMLIWAKIAWNGVMELRRRRSAL